MNRSTFTPQELALLRLSDQAEEVETEAERQARYSRESRARRRAKMGDAAYREMITKRTAKWRQRRVAQ
jgi:hypothetical protein